MASFDDFLKLDIRVGTIVSAKNFEKARKPAYQLEVDMGQELGIKRSSAQITDHYRPEELVGKQVLFVANFAPRKMMGEESQGMILSAVNYDGTLSVTTTSKDVKPGSQVG